jgi:hypothetical protein
MPLCDWCGEEAGLHFNTIDSVVLCNVCIGEPEAVPMIHGEWIPPSQIIAEVGLDAFLQQYHPEELASLAKSKPVPVKEKKVATKVMEALGGFKFGCDPEGFIKNTQTGEYVTAEGLIPGTKLEPYPVKHGAVQVDGMAAEFNIDPASDFTTFNRNIAAVINQLEKMLPEHHVLEFVPAVRFREEEFNNAPDKAKELGCSPDFNAWTGEVNPPPANPDDPFLRTASGHLHIGWSEGEDITDAQHLLNCNDLVRQFDWMLGGWSVTVDTDPTRRNLYGRAGACRYKSYGVEYRVLSNFWVVSRELRLAVWNRMQLAIGSMAKEFMPDRAVSIYNTMLQSGINESKLPMELLRQYPYPLLQTEPPAPTTVRTRTRKYAYRSDQCPDRLLIWQVLPRGYHAQRTPERL